MLKQDGPLHPPFPADWLARVETMLSSGKRRILGLAGAPGAGKSTLAEALAASLPGRAIVVPMDGFHLANVELRRLGRAGRKGAEDTFDSAGFVALLRRLRDPQPGEIVYAPAFDRALEEAIAGAIPVPPETPLVIAEGNYLLLDRGHWAALRPLLDEVWYVGVDPLLRRERLIARHIRFGRDEQAAEAWVDGTDEPNAAMIEATRGRADFTVEWS